MTAAGASIGTTTTTFIWVQDMLCSVFVGPIARDGSSSSSRHVQSVARRQLVVCGAGCSFLCSQRFSTWRVLSVLWVPRVTLVTLVMFAVGLLMSAV